MKMPLMINMEGRAVVLGGGNVGMHKVSQLSKFDVDIVLIDMEEIDASANAELINVELIKIEVKPENINGIIPEDAVLVISALEDRELNALVAEHCRTRGILVNVVDDPDLSTAFFTAFSKKGDIAVSITTTGQCPFLARKMREEMDNSIDEWESWLQVLSPIRCGIDGIEDKNKILTDIYENDNIRELVKAGNIEEAKRLARELSNVHS